MSKCYACGKPIRRGYPMVTNNGENVIVCERCKRLWKKIESRFVKCKCGVEQSTLYAQRCDAVKRWNKRKTEQTEREGE